MPRLGDEVQAFKTFNLHFCMCVGMYVCVCTCHDTVAEVRRKLVRVSFHFLLCRSHSSKLRPSGLVAVPSFACWAILLAQSCSSFSSSSFSSSPLLLLLFPPLLPHKTSKLFVQLFGVLVSVATWLCCRVQSLLVVSASQRTLVSATPSPHFLSVLCDQLFRFHI